jgi:hypothetical protein
MKGYRRMALAIAVPMVAVSLSGAATNPTVTYHGVFDLGRATDLLDPSASCMGGMFDGQYSGVWNIQIPDPEGSVAFVQVTIKLEGRPHAVWRDKFVMDPTSDGFIAERTTVFTINPWTDEPLPAPVTDVQVVTLEDGELVYTLDSEMIGCAGYFEGHATN